MFNLLLQVLLNQAAPELPRLKAFVIFLSKFSQSVAQGRFNQAVLTIDPGLNTLATQRDASC